MASATKVGCVFLLLCVCHQSMISSERVPFVEKQYEQVLDHFNFNAEKIYGQNTFMQRYLIQDKWWDKGRGPIFFYTGNEGAITSFWDNTGFVFDIAPHFKALVIFAEHRFYGKSLPFGEVKSFQSPYVGLLTVEQALADFATLLQALKPTLNATNVPVISFGGSYGGMLTAYMRFKYPNIIDGGLAASAPIYLVGGAVNRDFFFSDVTTDFKNAAAGCDTGVRQGFIEMARLAAMGTSGLKKISTTFKLCKPLTNSTGYKHLVGWIRNSFTSVAMMDYPYPTSFLAPLPAFPVKEACKRQLEARDVLSGLAAAAGLFYGSPKCYDIWSDYVECADPTGCGTGPNSLAWDYQACTEMLMPEGTNNVTDFFPVLPWTLEQRATYCKQRWGVDQRLDWFGVSMWNDKIKTATNLVFSNGDLDPWHRGGVLQNISASLISVMIRGGAHHLDLRAHTAEDPESVMEARLSEINYISNWIKEANWRRQHQGL